MAKCSHCSAPLPKDSIICSYCGVRNDIELKTKNIGVETPDSNRFCPDCLIALKSINIGQGKRFIVEKCSQCYGLFFDKGELDILLEEKVDAPVQINHQKLHDLLQNPLHKDKITYRRCPVCLKTMHRKNYKRRSGIIMDVCFEHGVWLDAGEFKQIQEWIRLGGIKKIEEQSSKTFSSQKQNDEFATLDFMYDLVSYAFH